LVSEVKEPKAAIIITSAGAKEFAEGRELEDCEQVSINNYGFRVDEK